MVCHYAVIFVSFNPIRLSGRKLWSVHRILQAATFISCQVKRPTRPRMGADLLRERRFSKGKAEISIYCVVLEFV